jgi:hypothetical protein
LLQKQGRQPDFNSKAKDNEGKRMGLWVDSKYTPEWVIAHLLPGGRQRNNDRSGGNSRYNNNNSYGNQGGGGADAYMPEEASSDVEASWMDLCQNYRGWFDNRANVSLCAVRSAAAVWRVGLKKL